MKQKNLIIKTMIIKTRSNIKTNKINLNLRIKTQFKFFDIEKHVFSAVYFLLGGV
jgi:hypothetical protein